MQQLKQSNEFTKEMGAVWKCETSTYFGGYWEVKESSWFKHMALLVSLGCGAPLNITSLGNGVYFLLYFTELQIFSSFYIKTHEPDMFYQNFVSSLELNRGIRKK